MRWYNFDTGVLDTLDEFPELPEEWEPYLPVIRRMEFWLRQEVHPITLKQVVLDIIVQENNKTIPAHEIISESLALPAGA